MPVDKASLKRIASALILAIGEDPDRPGLVDTPERIANWWAEFIDFAPGNCETVFAAECTDQMVCVSGMRVWSLCEHHLLPFWCDVAIGYVSDKKIVGLSKFARIAHRAAHRLQVQERLAAEIAEDVVKAAQTENVAVVTNGQHLCMMMRGVRTVGDMTVSVMRGVFRENAAARAEFLAMIK